MEDQELQRLAKRDEDYRKSVIANTVESWECSRDLPNGSVGLNEIRRAMIEELEAKVGDKVDYVFYQWEETLDEIGCLSTITLIARLTADARRDYESARR